MNEYNFGHNFNWVCPHCNKHTTITTANCHTTSSDLPIDNSEGYRSLEITWIVCPNSMCKRISLKAELYSFDVKIDKRIEKENVKLIKEWRLLPESYAKVFPDYIPVQIRNDYIEAVAIVELSPNASATISRRCLQGMINDFWKVNCEKLYDAIIKIKPSVDPITYKSIDAVRSIGNIAAHMRKDVNLIVDVEPNEARLLIKLIETLIEEWYIHKYERDENFNEVIKIAHNKINKKKQAKSQSSLPVKKGKK